MSSANNDLFYSRLPVNEIPLSELLAEEHLFYKIPSNWHVVITDVKSSTKAIERGVHETVNLLATGSIVAVLNIAYKAHISIPFFFGGDGASFIVPPSIFEPVLKALSIYRENTLDNFNLDLRVGTVPVADIYQAGHLLQISKLRSTQLFIIPVVLGDGLAYAEKIIKGEDYKLLHVNKEPEELDLTGMQCRWDKIKPPENFDEVVSLLVTARNSEQQAGVFKKVIDLLDNIYGEPERRKPISIPMLKLKATIGKIGLEMRTRFGRLKPVYLFSNWIKMLLGYFYFRTRKGKEYLRQLVALSDTLVIDGKVNTVISGTAVQREKLQAALNQLEQEGEINYGLYVSRESVMSCYVRNLNEEHIHFVDGAEGGYTKAAGMLKRKMVHPA
ncbi:DUF3095 domain-containing protein [Terrimonas pollutisoli]|uniref:DUF3095 domain-containing protein n=1 Tax=Terrimonas pollutisoli TaxID=3034147 RepID=UPI0023ED013A|nr:DUF3095 domain-containing protein [Terrimonas sp. H1YJ31]